MKERRKMLINKDIDIILASKSPRRRELLSQIDIKYRCIVSEKEEIITKEKPDEVVKELSYQKANDIYESLLKSNELEKDTIIIGADTVVSYENKILGKPKDKEDAANMVRLMQGREHQVYTGLAILEFDEMGKETVTNHAVCTNVYVAAMSEEEILEYVQDETIMDKAGAYAIQGAFGAKFIERFEGDYYNVVGLPISYIYQILK